MGTFECCKRSSDTDIPSPNKIRTINDINFPYSEFESTIKEQFYVDINIKALIQRNHLFNIEEYSYDDFVPLIEIYNDTTVIDTIIYHVSDSDDESNEDNDKYIFDYKKSYMFNKEKLCSCLRFVVKNEKNNVLIGYSETYPISIFAGNKKRNITVDINQCFDILFGIDITLNVRCKETLVNEGILGDIDNEDEDILDNETKQMRHFYYYGINKEYDVIKAMKYIEENESRSFDINKAKQKLSEINPLKVKEYYYLCYEIFLYMIDAIKSSQSSIDIFDNDETFACYLFDYSYFYIHNVTTMIYYSVKNTNDERIIIQCSNIVIDLLNHIEGKSYIIEDIIHIVNQCVDKMNSYAFSIKIIQNIPLIQSKLKDSSSSISSIQFITLITKLITILNNTNELSSSALTQSLIITEELSYQIISQIVSLMTKQSSFPLFIYNSFSLMKIMIRYIIRIDTKTIDRLSMIMNLYHMNYSRDIDRDINKAYVSLIASLYLKAKKIEESHMIKLINTFFEIDGKSKEEEGNGYSTRIGECYSIHIDIINIIESIHHKEQLSDNIYRECIVILKKISERISDSGLDIVTEINTISNIPNEDFSNNIISMLKLLSNVNRESLANEFSSLKSLSSDLVIYLKSKDLPLIEQIAAMLNEYK